MSAGRIVLLVFGILFVLGSFGLLIGGGVVLTVDHAFKDDQGYYSTDTLPVYSNTPAVITQSAEIHLGTWWFNRDRDLVYFKISAENSDPSKPVFIGIARESDLDRYLNGIAHSEVRDFDYYPHELHYFHRSGAPAAEPPADQTFWVASASGTGTQTLEWDVSSGTYNVVFMNADGSSPIAGSASIGIRIPQVISNVGWGLIIGGIIFLVGGGVMIFFAARGW